METINYVNPQVNEEVLVGKSLNSVSYRFVEEENWVEVASFYGTEKCDEYGMKQLREMVRDNSYGKCDLVDGEFISTSSDWNIAKKNGVLLIFHREVKGHWEEFDDLFGVD